jgi:hypothetical protein
VACEFNCASVGRRQGLDHAIGPAFCLHEGRPCDKVRCTAWQPRGTAPSRPGRRAVTFESATLRQGLFG